MFRHLLLAQSRGILLQRALCSRSKTYSSNSPTRHNSSRREYHHGNHNGGSTKSPNNNKKWKYMLAAAGALAYSPPDRPSQPTIDDNAMNSGLYEVSWNEFCYQMLAKGEVRRLIIRSNNTVRIILHEGAVINGKQLSSRVCYLEVPDINKFELKLREFEKTLGIRPGDEVPVVYETAISGPFIVGMIILGYFIYKYRLMNKLTPESLVSGFSKAKFTLVDPTKRASDATSIRFKDVAGLKEAKVEIMEFVEYLKNSERFLKLGAKLPKGVLLTGPPGCGKTLLAKAVATEADVPFLALAGSDFVEMIGGVGASRVRSLFKQANKLSPCIIYIDEIDSIGKKRSGAQSQGFNREMEQTLNQLLVEMDGMISRKSVILLASTNRADVLDKALLRAGRFDRQIMIDLPNLEERREIFEQHASKIKLEKPVGELALRVAQLTPGMSGADIANVCNEAALHAARKDRLYVLSDDLEYAIERVVGGTEKKSSSMSAAERKIIAYHESGHALVGWLLEHTEPILKISIVPRTTNMLGFTQYLPIDRKLYNQEQISDRMCMALGGRVAELIKFKHLSTGAHDDLSRVTKMAMLQVKQYGFDSVIGNLSFPEEDPNDMGKKPYSKLLANVIDQRASLIVRNAFEKTRKLLEANTEQLNLLAEALLKKEVMNYSDIENLIGPPRYDKRSQST